MPSRLFRDPAVRAVPWRDLCDSTPLQTISGLLLSLPWLVLSLVLAQAGYLVAALACSFVFFMTGLRQAHEGFHGNLGLPRRASDGFLFLLSLAMGVPLHAVKFNHLRHHAHPLAEDDVEGACARLPGWLAIVAGPWFTVRMMVHAARQARPEVRRWMGVEVVALLALAGVAVWTEWYWLRYHLVVMLLGNCLTGFFAVWLVHHDCEVEGVFARTQRGWLVNFLTLNLLYHLEHHLFPAVPAARLPELARRLDAVLPVAPAVPVVAIRARSAHE